MTTQIGSGSGYVTVITKHFGGGKTRLSVPGDVTAEQLLEIVAKSIGFHARDVKLGFDESWPLGMTGGFGWYGDEGPRFNFGSLGETARGTAGKVNDLSPNVQILPLLGIWIHESGVKQVLVAVSEPPEEIGLNGMVVRN